MDQLTDIQLWRLAQSGEEPAFEQLYKRHAAALFRYGQGLTSQLDIIENSIQDIFIHLWEAKNDLCIHRSPKSYLLTMLRRDLLHKLTRLSRFNQPVYPEEFFIDENMLDQLLKREQQEQQSALLKIALNRLSKRQKEALHLKFIENLRYAEIADIMHLQVPTLYNMLSRALKTLRKQVEKRQNHSEYATIKKIF